MTSPKQATTRGDGTRTYTWRNERFFSVTTIIGGGIPKPVLVNWAKKFTAEYAVNHIDALNTLVADDRDGAVDWLKGAAYRDRDRAAELGTDVHNAVEAYALGKPYPTWGPLVKPRMDAFVRFLDQYEPVYELTEASIFNRAERYAGTLDAIATFPTLGDRRFLFDVKTGGKAVYPEAAVQLAAYRYAEFVGAPDGSEQPLPEVDACAVLHIPDGGGFEFVEVIADREIFQAFLFAREVYRWATVTSKSVILGPLEPGKLPLTTEVPA
jgi:hypothetical protein